MKALGDDLEVPDVDFEFDLPTWGGGASSPGPLEDLRSLPAPQRAVLALSALQDLPRVEIAAILGVPEGTVHSRLHHARNRLRERLERDGSAS